MEENKDKLFYESPEAEIIQVRVGRCLLQTSDSLVVDDYDPWEGEDI